MAGRSPFSKLFSKKEFHPTYVEMPMDPNEPCYSLSFSADQVEEYKRFFDEYGYVVVRDVLTADDCQATIDDIWTYLETGAFGGIDPGIKRDNPSTWTKGWPPMQKSGILGVLPVFTKRAQDNRQNPRVYEVFANILGEKELMVNQDRYGLFRPTIEEDGTVHDEWKTVRNVHLDMNPWVYTLPRGKGEEYDVSKLDYLSNSHFFEENNHPGRLQDGKLHLQGFHKIFKEWTDCNRRDLGKKYADQRTFISIPEEDPVWSHAQRLTGRAGSLFVWNQLVAHGSAPNNSTRARYAQFLKYQSAVSLESNRGHMRKEVLSCHVQHYGVALTELGQKLLSQRSW
ncbi:hypothetical protein EMCRGX_G026451 [Ephydatia muelleri]